MVTTLPGTTTSGVGAEPFAIAMEAAFSAFVLWPLVRLVGWLVLAPLAGVHLMWRCAVGGATGVFAPPLETAVPAAYTARSGGRHGHVDAAGVRVHYIEAAPATMTRCDRSRVGRGVRAGGGGGANLGQYVSAPTTAAGAAPPAHRRPPTRPH